MKLFIQTILLASLAFVSCEKYDTIKSVDNDFKTNYEEFWTLVDEQYCYLDYKNIDWVGVREEMMPRVEAAKSDLELFNLMEVSLDHLRDGHVWMVSDFKTYTCDTFLYDEQGELYPENFDRAVVKDCYLTECFRTRNGFIFGVIERNGKSFAYIHYHSFNVELEEIDIKYIAPLVEESDGIILDIRDNPGGVGDFGLNVAGHFFTEKSVVGYYAIKTGTGHNDMSELKPLHVTPSETYNWANKKTMLLTNRNVYSTANLFTSAMKLAKNVTQIGGISGGGGAMPMTHYLPNGWLLVFPGNMLFNVNKEHIEGGVEPDIEVTATDEELAKGRDLILEEAIQQLST